MTGVAAAVTYATYRTLQDFEASVEKIVYIEPRLKVQRRAFEGKPGVVIISEIFVTGMNIAGVPGGVRLRVETPHYEIPEPFELTSRFASAICAQTGTQERMDKAVRLVGEYFSKRDLICIGGILKVDGLLDDLAAQRDLDHNLWKITSIDGKRFLQAPQAKPAATAPAQQNPGEYSGLLDEILSGTKVDDESIH
jgi:hypothetical protein